MIKSFDEVFEDVTKLGVKIKTDEYHPIGKYQIIDQGQEAVAGYSDLEDGVFENVPAIVFGDHTRMESVCFGDDAEQNTTIAACKEQIDELNNRIFAAQAKLKENADIKSILYTNGEQLVSIVFRILEKLLNCDLSTFIDEKREDFLIKLPRCTFIGEIKGVTSNVKYEHISQLELHYRGYLDRLAETGEVETVKQLLIINPFRTKPLEQRDPVHTAQIELAIRNECLIIETCTLLRIYERFCVNRLTSQQCEEVFARRSGVIDLSDFDKPEDMEPYKV